MIIIKSNYSPACAIQELETENVQMMNMCLYFALPSDQLVLYIKYSEKAAKAYEFALGDDPVHSHEQWEAAKDAATPDRHAANSILQAAGVTIENKLVRPMIDGEPVIGQFCWIETTVYKGYDDHTTVAKIERAIDDVEAETYEDNSIGFGAENA